MEQVEHNYLSVRINTLRPMRTLGFNLYIQLPSKYLLYVRNDDSIDAERLASLKQRKVRKLYIEDRDEELYQDFLDGCLNESLNDTSLTIKDKGQIIVDIADNSLGRIYEQPEAQRSFRTAEKASDILQQVLGKNEEILKEMLSVASDENSDLEAKIRKHSLNVSSICIKFGEFLDFSVEDIRDMAIAGLYHDVSFVKYSKEEQEIFFKPIDSMTKEEKALYCKHPQRSHDILERKDFAPASILELILTHEERQDGQGFPGEVHKLTPVQEAFALVCSFDYRVTCLGESMSQVTKNLILDELGKFNLNTLKLFGDFLTRNKLNL